MWPIQVKNIADGTVTLIEGEEHPNHRTDARSKLRVHASTSFRSSSDAGRRAWHLVTTAR